MLGLIGARLVGEADESTELARRHAVWLFPSMVLLHAVFVRALAPGLQRANLILAIVALAGGLAYRWAQRATTVIVVLFGFSFLTFTYLFGIAVPMSYLIVSGQRDWVSWAAPTSAAVHTAFLLVRVRASLRSEWSKPLDEVAGIHIATNDWILRQEFGQRPSPILNMVAVGLGLAFIPLLTFTRGGASYLVLALLIGPLCIALMMTDGLARWVGFYVAVRRWEAAHGIRLRFPALRWRRRKPKRRRR
jgi:hypothetical protein